MDDSPMGLPHHPGHDNEPPTESPTSRMTAWVIAAGVALVVVVIVLHLTGVIGH
jgi:hypothetical protein